MRKALLIALAIALLSTLFILPACTSPTKAPTSSVQSPLDLLQTKVNALDSRVQGTEAKVAAIQSATGNITTVQSMLSDIQKDLSTIKSDVASLKTDITALKTSDTKIATDNAKATTDLASLDTRLDALEKQLAPTTDTSIDPEDAITLTAKYPNTLTVQPLAAGASTNVAVPVRFSVTNELAVPIKDVLLSARATYRADTGITVSKADLSGDLDWQAYSATDFELWDDLSLAASEKKTYSLVLTITVTSAAGTTTPSNLIVSFKGTADDYSIKK